MTTLDVANEHYRQRQSLIRALDAEGRHLWGQIAFRGLRRRLDINAWLERIPRLLVLLAATQRAAAQNADEYITEALAEQNESIQPLGSVNPEALTGVASDGRPLDTLLRSPIAAAVVALGAGATRSRALAAGQASLSMILSTQVADAGRIADAVAIAARPSVGYVRMLTPPSCSRCVLLAGRWYRYNAAFDRHPQCNCTQIPAREDAADDLRTDPVGYFRSLPRAEQDRVFTKAGAKGIRLGADMNQVVNARRGANGLTPAASRLTPEEAEAIRGGDRGRLRPTKVFGQDVFVTTEGTTTRGLAGQRLIAEGARLTVRAEETVRRVSREGVVERQVNRQRVQIPRLMPESILELAATQDEAIRLLRRFGYII